MTPPQGKSGLPSLPDRATAAPSIAILSLLSARPRDLLQLSQSAQTLRRVALLPTLSAFPTKAPNHLGAYLRAKDRIF
jgi:hypothetical protein